MVKIQISCTDIAEQNHIMRLLSPLVRVGKVKHRCDEKFIKTWLFVKDNGIK